jgi:hypothetical protein
MSASDFGDEVSPPPRSAVLVRLADVPPEPVKWLWKPYVPRRKVTLVVGDPGDGKTWMVNAMAAAITVGFGLPDPIHDGHPQAGSHPEPVLYLTAEDGLADTIRPRLDSMGADCEKFFALTAACDGDTETPVTLRDIDVLDDALTQTRAALVGVDPLQAFMGDRIDMHRANETRPVLAALARLAEKHDCAVVCICHLSKATQSRALYRVLGSIDFAAAVRSVLLVGRDPDDRCRRAVVQIKSNLAPEGPTLAYKIENDRFEWCGVSQLTAGALLSADATEDDRSALDEAKDLLKDLLSDGPQPAKHVEHEARAAGVAERTLKRAKSALGIRSQKVGGVWQWLPGKGANSVKEELGTLGTLDLDEGVIS